MVGLMDEGENVFFFFFLKSSYAEKRIHFQSAHLKQTCRITYLYLQVDSVYAEMYCSRQFFPAFGFFFFYFFFFIVDLDSFFFVCLVCAKKEKIKSYFLVFLFSFRNGKGMNTTSTD